MSRKIDPFKIELLLPTKKDLMGVKEIKVMDIMEGFTKNFHPDGLFSAEIFGKVGEERRSRTFGYINLHIKIFHPLIYKVICDLKELYAEVMAGKSYAIFDETINDFVKSNVAEGETGYAFFVKHFSKLQFEKRDSITRKLYIEFVEMHRKDPYIEQLVILPAGMRDYMVDEDGKPSEDEINAMYRSIMSAASALENLRLDENPDFADSSRSNLQTKILELYRYLISLIVGKHRLLQGSFMSRKVSNTTRNVISSYNPEVRKFGDDASVSPNTIVMGLYQYLRDILPLVVYNVRSKYAHLVFSSAQTNMTVTDAKTLTSKQVPVVSKAYNTWMTYDGIEKVCDQYSQESMRHYPIMIGADYLGLIYKGPDGTFKFLQDINEIPQGRSKKDVSPITMTEFLYLSVYEEAQDSFGYTTRYPVTSFGSTFPGDIFLRTTTHSEVRIELDDNWQPTAKKANAFPINGERFFNSLSIPTSHLQRTGGDFDGDQMSHYCVLTQEAKDEVRGILASRDYYLNLDNTMAFSQDSDTISLALKYMTGR